MFRNVLVVARGAAADQPAIQRALLGATRGARLVILDLVHEPVLDGYLGNTVIYEPLRARVVAKRRSAVEALAAGIAKRGFEAVGQAKERCRRTRNYLCRARRRKPTIAVDKATGERRWLIA
jgi:hypothetical protein